MSGGEEVMKGNIDPMAAEMKKMINNKEMSDVKFLVGPNRKAIYCHRLLLSARCDVFRAMFSEQAAGSETREIPFVLPELTPEIFLAVLEFIYTNCITLNSKIAIDVLGSAIEFGLDELKQLCNQYLIQGLSANNACNIMQAAVCYNQEDLKADALKYIEQNTQNVFKTKGFHEMGDEAMIAVLQSNQLKMDEFEIVECVREWATVNSVILGRSVSDIARRVTEHLRLPLLSPAELKEVEDESAKDRLISMEYISYAWRCHALKKGDKESAVMKVRVGTKPRDFHKTYLQG